MKDLVDHDAAEVDRVRAGGDAAGHAGGRQLDGDRGQPARPAVTVRVPVDGPTGGAAVTAKVSGVEAARRQRRGQGGRLDHRDLEPGTVIARSVSVVVPEPGLTARNSWLRDWPTQIVPKSTAVLGGEREVGGAGRADRGSIVRTPSAKGSVTWPAMS